MKKPILSIMLCVALCSYGQDSLKIKQIDSLVKVINQSNYKVEHDSIFHDYSQLGASIRTYLTLVTDSNEIKKYVNEVHTARQETDSITYMTTCNVFFFNHNQLIKVEEFALTGGKEIHADWYYADGKPLYHTFKSDKSENRAVLLLAMAEQMLKQVQVKRR